MKSLLCPLLVAAGTMAVGEISLAQKIYTCRDSGGHMMTSDRPIPECADRAMKELNSQGMVVREIPAPLTDAQRAQKELDDRQRREAEEQEKEQRQHDRALLMAYRDEAAIEAARQRALADAQGMIQLAQGRRTQLLKDRENNRAEQDALKGKPVPGYLKHKIDDTEAEIALQDKTIADRMQETDRINRKFDTDEQHFRALTQNGPH
jgi:hypothetical protein